MFLFKRATISLLIFFLFSSRLALADNSEKADSLLKLLPQAKDTLRVKILTELCWEFCYNEPEKALEYGKEALEIATLLNYENGLAASNNRIGIVYDVTGKYDKALDHYKTSLKYSIKINNRKSIASVLNNIGLIYWNLGDYNIALENYFASLKVFEEINNEKGIANTLNNIGLVYWDNKQLDKALDFQTQAIEARKKINDEHGVGASLTNIALIYHDMKEYDKSIEYFERSIELKEKTKDEYGLGIALKGLGASYESKGNTEEALKYFSKALEIKMKVNDQYGIASTHLDMASIYIRAKKYDVALEHLEQAKEIGEKTNSFKLLYKAYSGMATCYNRKGDYKNAFLYQKKYSVAYDSMFNEQKSKQISELQTLYETQKKEQEIKLLNKEIEISELQLKRKNLQLGWIGGISLIIILTMAILYQRYRIRQQKLLQQEREKQQQIRMKAVIETQENERNRISKDLHDGIGQLLAAAKINLSSFEDEITGMTDWKKEKLEHSTRILNEAITEVSSISQQMMPRVLRENGLIPAIENLLDKTFGKTQITYHFHQHGINGRLAENIEVGLYRIVQELIGNIVKHAKATEVNVQLSKAKSHLVLTVEDNGIGIPDKPKRNGMGLDNIASRTEALHGNYHYQSVNGRGTISTIRIPLQTEL
jgi:two-component system, NarL family, sensor kinase